MENITFNSIKKDLTLFLNKTSFITTALPYANGNLHLGHFYEAVITDIYHKNQPNSVFLSGDDQHGAAITIYCKKNNLNEESHITEQLNAHLRQYKKLEINHDYFGETHSDLHQQLTQYFFNELYNQQKIVKKQTLSWYDSQEKQFLPDRYVRGNCPHCNQENQYPEICENCGVHFKNEELVNPVSILSNKTPYLKESEHFFLDTKEYYTDLKKELLNNSNIICDQACSKLLDNSLEIKEFIDISRDKPYFGIDIPINKEQCFYVWFDAPIAYISFALEYLSKKVKEKYGIDLSFEELISLLPYIKFEHFIGKDIIYFHTYYWINLLKDLNVCKVHTIKSHGWITEHGKKFSKSNGNDNDLLPWSDSEIDALRLFFFSIYEDNVQDNELNIENVFIVYNQVIIGKYINIYSRISKIIETKLDGFLINNQNLHKSIEKEVLNKWIVKNEIIKSLIKKTKFKKGFEDFILLLNEINAFIQETTPWKIEDKEKLERICAICYQIFLEINDWLITVCPNIGQVIKNRVKRIDNNIHEKIIHQTLQVKIPLIKNE